MVAARNVEAAASDAALPWPPPGTASAPTAVAVPLAAAVLASAVAVVVDSAPLVAVAANQSRLIAS